MFLEIKCGGWGFSLEDVGKMVKVVALTEHFGAPGARVECHSQLKTSAIVGEGEMSCGLHSFLPPGRSSADVEDLAEEIQRSLSLDALLATSDESSEAENQGQTVEFMELDGIRRSYPTPGRPVQSDGGSSLYYDLPIPQKLLDKLIERSEQGSCYIKTEEIITHLLANSFDYGNLFKSLIRCKGLQDGTGGKAGNSVDYECNKMKYSVEKIREMKCA